MQNKYTHKKNQFGFYKPGDMVMCTMEENHFWYSGETNYKKGDIGIVVCEVEEAVPGNNSVFNGIMFDDPKHERRADKLRTKYYPTIQVMWHRTGKKTVIDKQHVKSVPKVERVSQRVN